MTGSRRILQIARLVCLLTLSGYALKHFAWTGRLVSRIYSEGFIDFCVRSLGLSWNGFFHAGGVNPNYRVFIYIVGSLFLLGAITTMLRIPVIQRSQRSYIKVLYILCSLLIAMSAISATIKSQLHLNVMIEFSVQIFVALLFLYHALGRAFQPVRHIRTVKWILALTFTGHGLYALNIFPLPANFVMMTSNILQTGRDGSILFLAIVGGLDILVSVLIFYKKTERIALIYMMAWGFLTALARLVAYQGVEGSSTYLAMWMPEFLVRSGHYLLPLYLLVYIKNNG